MEEPLRLSKENAIFFVIGALAFGILYTSLRIVVDRIVSTHSLHLRLKHEEEEHRSLLA